jgi:hypothetical protein
LKEHGFNLPPEPAPLATFSRAESSERRAGFAILTRPWLLLALGFSQETASGRPAANFEAEIMSDA